MTAPHFARSLVLSPDLIGRGIALRGERVGDADFLRELYISVRWEELARVGWSDEQKIAFLSDQFRFQVAHYSQHYADSDFGIATEHGAPIGRLYLFRGHPRDLRIVDISLLPPWRNAGIGGALLQAVGAEAAAEGKIVSIHVESFNPAQRLYRRIGFVDAGDEAADGPYRRMDWNPRPASRPEGA